MNGTVKLLLEAGLQEEMMEEDLLIAVHGVQYDQPCIIPVTAEITNSGAIAFIHEDPQAAPPQLIKQFEVGVGWSEMTDEWIGKTQCPQRVPAIRNEDIAQLKNSLQHSLTECGQLEGIRNELFDTSMNSIRVSADSFSRILQLVPAYGVVVRGCCTLASSLMTLATLSRSPEMAKITASQLEEACCTFVGIALSVICLGECLHELITASQVPVQLESSSRQLIRMVLEPIQDCALAVMPGLRDAFEACKAVAMNAVDARKDNALPSMPSASLCVRDGIPVVSESLTGSQHTMAARRALVSTSTVGGWTLHNAILSLTSTLEQEQSNQPLQKQKVNRRFSWTVEEICAAEPIRR
jgi:hypothetical protein